VCFDISMVEGIEGVAHLLEQVSPERFYFGSQLSFFYFEAALLKMKESGLPEDGKGGVRRQRKANASAQQTLNVSNACRGHSFDAGRGDAEKSKQVILRDRDSASEFETNADEIDEAVNCRSSSRSFILLAQQLNQDASAWMTGSRKSNFRPENAVAQVRTLRTRSGGNTWCGKNSGSFRRLADYAGPSMPESPAGSKPMAMSLRSHL